MKEEGKMPQFAEIEIEKISLEPVAQRLRPSGLMMTLTRVVTATASSSTWLLSPLQPEGRYPSHRLY